VLPLTALYDASVLYPAPIRDLLLRLAVTELVHAKWTDIIHEEWMRNVLKNRPDLSRERLGRTRELMNAHTRDALVTGFEALVPTLVLPDPGDRHVLAAAIRARADVIVTYNLKDFPTSRLSPYGIEAQHPDVFITSLIDRDASAVCEAVRRQRQALKKPAMTAEALLALLEETHGLKETVRRLRRLHHLL
jgi:predicted nucleic acid-binding protein